MHTLAALLFDKAQRVVGLRLGEFFDHQRGEGVSGGKPIIRERLPALSAMVGGVERVPVGHGEPRQKKPLGFPKGGEWLVRWADCLTANPPDGLRVYAAD